MVGDVVNFLDDSKHLVATVGFGVVELAEDKLDWLEFFAEIVEFCVGDFFVGGGVLEH